MHLKKRFLFLALNLVCGFLMLTPLKADLNQDTLEQACKIIPVLREFRELYDHPYLNLVKEHGRWRVQGRVIISPQYEFLMDQQIAEPEYGAQPMPTQSPQFILREIKRVYFDDDGKLQVEYSLPIAEFSSETWVKFHQAKGNFGAIGIKLLGASQISNLQEYIRQLDDKRML
jgi:hypothetical protein